MLNKPLEHILNDALIQHGLLEILYNLLKLVNKSEIWKEFAPDIEKLTEKISQTMQQ